MPSVQSFQAATVFCRVVPSFSNYLMVWSWQGQYVKFVFVAVRPWQRFWDDVGDGNCLAADDVYKVGPAINDRHGLWR